MAADPKTAEVFLELIFLRQVVIRTQHTQEYALPETARTDEEQAVRLLLQQGRFWENDFVGTFKFSSPLSVYLMPTVYSQMSFLEC